MGLVLDSGVLIAAERDAKPASELLAILEHEHGETEIVPPVDGWHSGRSGSYQEQVDRLMRAAG